MPLNKGGREALADFQKRYGEKKGKKYFYAAVNSGKVKNVDTHDCGCGGSCCKDEEPRKKKHRRHLRAHEVHGIINGIFFPIYQRCHPTETGTQDPTSVQPAGASTATGAAPPAGA